MFASKRDKTIPLRSITSVEVKEPSAYAGFIQFSLAGGPARNSSFTVTGGAFDAAGDENSVLFLGDEKYRTALAIRTYVKNWQAEQQSQSRPSVEAHSVADEIRKLKALLDDGLLTPAEFEAQKTRLLL